MYRLIIILNYPKCSHAPIFIINPQFYIINLSVRTADKKYAIYHSICVVR